MNQILDDSKDRRAARRHGVSAPVRCSCRAAARGHRSGGATRRRSGSRLGAARAVASASRARGARGEHEPGAVGAAQERLDQRRRARGRSTPARRPAARAPPSRPSTRTSRPAGAIRKRTTAARSRVGCERPGRAAERREHGGGAQVDAERRGAQLAVVTAAEARRHLHHARPVRREQHLRVGRAAVEPERAAGGLGRRHDAGDRVLRRIEVRRRDAERQRALAVRDRQRDEAAAVDERVDRQLRALDELLAERAAVARILLRGAAAAPASPPGSTISRPRWP